MKHFPLLALAALVLAGCSKPSGIETVQNSEPISPVYALQEGNTTVIWTDYVPTLAPLDTAVIKVAVSGDYSITAMSPDSMVVAGTARTPEVITLSDGKHEAVIPILPALAYHDGLTSFALHGDKNNGITIGFVKAVAEQVTEPSFIVLIQNTILPKDVITKENDGTWNISYNKEEIAKGRTYLRVFASDTNRRYNDLLIPLENGIPVNSATELTRHDANAQILYSLMVDRFNNGNSANDAPLNSPDVLPQVDYQGGDLAGVTQKINEGFFDSLSINTIWLSPLSQNPLTAWGMNKDPYTRFSGYHGYWPVYNTKLDDRMGTPEELKALLSSAHEHNINVILDYVANHLHIESPTLQEHPDWITDSILPDGRRNFELWDECRLTTWFDVHIPSLDLERDDVCDAMTDTALYWVENYDFDGYRHDACKHIPLNYWRMFTSKMKKRLPDRQMWMIGETYGSPELISSYVKTGMLNAQFDFTIYHTAIDVFGQGQSMKRIAAAVDEACRFYGSHHTMGNISGNHDKCRFISLAGGAVAWDEDAKYAGWTRQIGVTATPDPAREERAFKKALLLEVLNMTIPGVPCIYQGDEYGQAGANDPDNRRMMRFSGLNTNEEHMREKVQALTHMRRNSMPMLYGDYHLMYCDDDLYVFSRTYMGDTVVVAINNAETDKNITVEGIDIHVEPNGYVIM